MAGKKKRNRNNLTPREQEFCDNYSRYAGNLRKVSSAMHITMQVCSNYLDNDRVKEYLGCTLKRSRDALISALPSVIDNMIELIHSDDTPSSTKAQLTIALLDRAGLQPPKGQVNINVNTLISEQARRLLSERIGQPVPPIAQSVHIKQEDFT